MNINNLHDFLLYSLIINYAILLVWFGVFVFAHAWVYQLHTRWFNLSRQSFDTVHYAGLAIYKIGIVLFNLVPLIGLCLLY